MINHDNVLTRPGNGGENAAPSPRSAGEFLKHVPALLLVARQTSIQRTFRSRSVVGVVLNLGRRAGQRALLSGVLPVVHPYARAGVGEADLFLKAFDPLVLVEEGALDAFLGGRGEVGGGQVYGQILRGGTGTARAVVGDDGPVGQCGLLVGVADEEVFLWCVGAEIAVLLLLLARRVLDRANAKDIVGTVQIFRIGRQFRIDVHGELVHDAAYGRIAQVDGIVLRWVELTLLVVVRVARQLVRIDGPLTAQGVNRGCAVLHLGPSGGTRIGFTRRRSAGDAVAVTAHGDGVLLRRSGEEEPKQDGENDRHDHRKGDGNDAATAGHD